MFKSSQAVIQRIVIGVILLVVFAGAFVAWHYWTEAPNPRDFGSQMIKYTKQGRYDAAVQVGLNALRNDSRDGIVYQQVAMVYLERAYKDSKHREEWVTKGISYVEKSLSLNTNNDDVAGVLILQNALSFKEFGNLSADRRCAYYERARRLLEDRVPMLQGEKLTLEGRDFPLAPLRKENDKFLSEVKGRATSAGCQ
jgi:hypothetical protein